MLVASVFFMKNIFSISLIYIYIYIICYAVLLYFPLFLNLDYLPFRNWDESIPAVHTYEMWKNGNYMVTTYEGRPDMWYTKPPLLVWCQLLFVKLIGYNELAMRLPSALAGLFTVLILIWGLKKQTGKPLIGYLAGLALVTFNGYITIHGTRTGDPDSLLTLFLTAAAFIYFLIHEKKISITYYVLFFLLITAAVMTKGVAGMLIMPGIALHFSLFQKEKIKQLMSLHLFWVFYY